MKKKYLTFTFWEKIIRHYVNLMLRKVWAPIISYRQARLAFTPANAIVIFGAPRGGTTWMLEIISHVKGTVPNFEPFHAVQGVVPNDLDLHAVSEAYTPEAAPQLIDFLTQTLTGARFNFWTTMYTRPHHFRNPRYVVTKTIRGHHLLPFVVSNMSLSRPPVVIVRHPIPTCQSQLQSFGNNGRARRMTADEIDQKRGLLQRHKQILLAPSSDLAYKVMLWCIFHVPILKDEAVLQRTILVLYEDLLLNPAAETNRIIRQLNLNEDHFDAATINFRKASKTNFNASLEAAPLKQLEKGIKQLSETELNEIQQVLDYFSVKLYTASSPVPNKAFLPGSLHGGVIPGQ